MSRYLFAMVFVFASASFGQTLLVPEAHFFGMPNVDSLSSDWVIALADSQDFGFFQPMDIEVLRLSASDYRYIILDAFGNTFLEFRVNQQGGLAANDLFPSGEPPEGCGVASAMCLVQRGTRPQPRLV
jgi:hypothetical protein